MQEFNAIEHMKLLKLEAEMYLKEIKHAYNKKKEVDNEGVELKQLKDGSFEAVNFKPFWEVSR